MKSKEALENVKIAPSFMGGNPRYWAYSESSIPFLEDINTIKKDLEVLELLKREMFNENKCFDLDEGWYDDSFSFSKDEQKKINGWLEDE